MNESSASWLAPNVDGLYPAIDVALHYTFKRIECSKLPRLAPVDGSFGWLPSLAPGRAPIPLVFDGEDDPVAVARHGVRVGHEARAQGLELPQTFVSFIESPVLTARIPSAVGGYFEVGELESLPHVTGPERLVRFFVDPQTYLWALLLEPGGQHRIVFASPDRTGDFSLTNITMCAPSFEVFLKRFWIEQTLALSLPRDEPVIDDVLRGYLEATARVVP